MASCTATFATARPAEGEPRQIFGDSAVNRLGDEVKPFAWSVLDDGNQKPQERKQHRQEQQDAAGPEQKADVRPGSGIENVDLARIAEQPIPVFDNVMFKRHCGFFSLAITE